MRGIDEAAAVAVWNMILSFAGYSFCKPHSASYALVSFKSAWLRAHHPAEFMAAVISNGGGYYSTFAYISEARRMGLAVLLPDVNASRREYTGRTFGDAGNSPAGAGPDEKSGGGTSGEGAIDEETGGRPEYEGAKDGEGTNDERTSGDAQYNGSRRGIAGGRGATNDNAAGARVRTRGEIRVGLMQLKGFPDAAIDGLLSERERRGAFESFEDFLERAGDRIGPAGIRILIRAGAFDSLLAPMGANALPSCGGASLDARRQAAVEGPARCDARPACEDSSPPCRARDARSAHPALGRMETGSSRGGAALDARALSRGDLFWRLAVWERARGRTGRDGSRLLLPPTDIGPLPRSGPYDERTTLTQEIETLGFLISRHPLTLFGREVARSAAVPAMDLRKHVGKRIRVVGWYVTGKTVQTRRGEPMEFLSFEDTTALYETTFFPRAYARFCHMMTKVRPYILTGRVEEDLGAVSLNVSDIRFLDGSPSGAEAGSSTRPRGFSAAAPLIPRDRGEGAPERPAHVGGTSPSSEAWNRPG